MTDNNHFQNGSQRRKSKIDPYAVGGIAALVVIIALVSWRFSSRSGWPWWSIPVGVVVGLLVIVVGLTLYDRKIPDLMKIVGEKRPGVPAVPGFTTAEFVDWPNQLPEGLVLSKEFGTFVVVANTPTAYEVWTISKVDEPTWIIPKAAQTMVIEKPGTATLMNREVKSIVITDGIVGSRVPTLDFVPSYTVNQMDDQAGSPELIERALRDLEIASQ